MTRSEQPSRWSRGIDWWATIAAFVLALLMIVAATQLHAQTFTVLHSFGHYPDGYEPLAGVTMDSHGNLYGITTFGGQNEFGIAFKLAPHGVDWIYSKLYDFNATSGYIPVAKLAIGRDGSLYGTATQGGAYVYDGTVFNLRPSPTVCRATACPWQATVIHNFDGYDGSYPTTMNFDSAGNILGTTFSGGPTGAGVIYRLTPCNGSWTFTTLSDFSGSSISEANGGVIPDQNGNLYGSALGPYPGVVFELTTSGEIQILHQFGSGGGTGLDPFDGLISDSAGNLYGLTAYEGPRGGGTVFELSPSDGNWTFNTLYGLTGGIWNGTLGTAALTMDAQGNLYGTTPGNGAHDHGSVFKLTNSPNGWTYTDLYDFTGGDDGCGPWTDVSIDRLGNLYGTASECGQYSGGTIWEITP